MCSFSCLNPIVIQSGNFSATTQMSKCGSSVIRVSLIYSAHNVVRNNQTLNDYHTLRRSKCNIHYYTLVTVLTNQLE